MPRILKLTYLKILAYHHVLSGLLNIGSLSEPKSHLSLKQKNLVHSRCFIMNLD